MKLLSAALSPFAARVRLAIYKYDLAVDIVPANMWLASGQKSPEYLALNPIGKVPTLLLDDGTSLPESDTIVEYLADASPGSGLRPGGARAKARTRLLARIYEQYVQTAAWGTLFAQAFATDRDTSAIDAAHARIHEGLGHLDHFMTDDRYAVGATLTTADCALVPFCFFHRLLLRSLGKDDPALHHRKLAAYLERVHADQTVQRVITEMREGLAASRLSFLLR